MSRVALQAALAAALLLSGCSVLGSDDPVREDRAVEALESARERAATVESYRYEMRFRVATADGSEEVSGDGSGRVNATARTLAAETSARGETRRAYVDGWTAYRECSAPGAFWGRENVTAGNWTAATPLGGQLGLLSTGDLYWNGTETLDGREAVRLTGRPSKAAMRERGDRPASGPLPGGRSVDEVTVDAWLDAETHRVVRTRLSVAVSANGRSATATTTIRYRDYGEPVTVTVPAEARETAFETGCPGG